MDYAQNRSPMRVGFGRPQKAKPPSPVCRTHGVPTTLLGHYVDRLIKDGDIAGALARQAAGTGSRCRARASWSRSQPKISSERPRATAAA